MLNWVKKIFSRSSPANGDVASPAPQATSQSLTAAANEQMRRGDFTAAVTNYREAINQSPESAEYHCSLAFALKELAQIDESKAHIAEALRLDPHHADAYYLLANLDQQSGNINDAIAHLRRAVEYNAKFEVAYCELSFLLFQTGSLDAAVDIANTGIKHCPDSADLHFYLGNFLHAQQNSETAIIHFDRALAIQPWREDALNNLSLCLLRAGKLERAITAMKQVAILQPSSISNLNDLAGSLLAAAHSNEAGINFLRALMIAPDDLVILLNAGRAKLAIEKAADAIPYLERALALEPRHCEGLQYLGDALIAVGKSDEGFAKYREAEQIDPHAAGVYLRFANAYFATDDNANALSNYRRALICDPSVLSAYLNGGIALKSLKREDEAVKQFQHALSLQPGMYQAHLNLGATLHVLKKFDEALTHYQHALDIHPDFPDAIVNVGSLQMETNRHKDAIASFHKALSLEANHLNAHLNLATALTKTKENQAALISCHNVLALNPAHATAWSNLGCLLHEMGKFDEATRCFHRALTLDYDNAQTHYNLGNALSALQQFESGVECYREAIRLKPSLTGAYGNLANILSDIGRFDESMETYRQALQCGPVDFKVYSNMLFVRNYMPNQSTAKLIEEAAHYGELATQKAQPYTAWPNSVDPQRRLRIGLVSGDLRHHPVGFFVDSTLAAFAAKNDCAVDIIAYSNYDHTDYLTERIKSHCYAWRLIADMSDEKVSKQIRSDDIDILLDLSGHSSMNRLPLFAWKAAPVQASWLGYFATTGLPAIDYFIADPWSIPKGNEDQFTETVWNLPETRFCFTAPDTDIGVSALPALNNGYVTFGCFNNLSKMTDQVVALWARIMHDTPGSRLFLKSIQLGGEKVCKEVVERFAVHGIAEDRLQMEGFTSRADYLAAYHRVDIALDPFPYTGGATTAESLWMGVPVFTLTGERLIGRQGTGLMMNAGLHDWVATNEDDYLQGVIRHASDLARLSALRAGLRAQVLASPLFDAKRLVHHFEEALRGMWATWCEQQSTKTH